MQVFIVTISFDYEGESVDSVWTDKGLADVRADAVGAERPFCEVEVTPYTLDVAEG